MLFKLISWEIATITRSLESQNCHIISAVLFLILRLTHCMITQWSLTLYRIVSYLADNVIQWVTVSTKETIIHIFWECPCAQRMLNNSRAIISNEGLNEASFKKIIFLGCNCKLTHSITTTNIIWIA